MRYLAVLLLCSCCFAQSKPISGSPEYRPGVVITAPDGTLGLVAKDEVDQFLKTNPSYKVGHPAGISKALRTCKSDLISTSASAEAASQAWIREQMDNKALLEKNAELAKKYYDVLQTAAAGRDEYFELLNKANDVINQYNTLATRANDLATKYNNLAAQYNAELRINNALAIYSQMPRFPSPPPQPSPQRNIHCTTNTVGNFTETNCN